MSTRNPFSDDTEKGEVFEQGYFAGFNQPDITAFLPLSPELLEIYKQGVEAGGEDRLAPPEGAERSEWAEVGADLAEHGALHALGLMIDHAFKTAVGGLIGLVITVIQIPGDVMIRPLEPEWEGPTEATGDTFLAMCPRTDHPMVQEGVTGDGYWMGPPHEEWVNAARDQAGHVHPESFVARCSLPDATCGPVWAVK